jgi:hypothetical protein
MKKTKKNQSISRYIKIMDQVPKFTLYLFLLVILSRCSEFDPVNEIVPDDSNLVLIDDVDFSTSDWSSLDTNPLD